MLKRPTLWAVFVLAFGGLSTAHAEVTISQSNNPKALLEDTVRSVLAKEHSAFSSLSKSRVKRHSAEPKQIFREAPAGAGRWRYDAAFLRARPFEKGGETWACLAEALYFEARGESVKGIFAVGEVILNRVRHPDFPNDVCDVVYQGTGKRFQCQFTYSCDGRKEVIAEPKAYRKVGKIAALMLDGQAPMDLTGGATHYHTKSVKPRWARVFPRTATIGYHHFYRKDELLASK